MNGMQIYLNLTYILNAVTITHQQTSLWFIDASINSIFRNFVLHRARKLTTLTNLFQYINSSSARYAAISYILKRS